MVFKCCFEKYGADKHSHYSFTHSKQIITTNDFFVLTHAGQLCALKKTNAETMGSIIDTTTRTKAL